MLLLLQVILPLMLLYSYILEKNCRTIRIYTWFWSMYQGEKCSVIWGGSDALGRLIWVISRKIILIWGFSLSLIVNFFLRELLLSCFVFLIDDFVWLKKKNKNKISYESEQSYFPSSTTTFLSREIFATNCTLSHYYYYKEK